MLKANPNDEAAFQKIVEEYGAVEGKNTYQSLAQDSLLYPRYSFRVTISNLSKLIKKWWGKIVEPLIFEKPRRKSSNTKSEKSSTSDGRHHTTFGSIRDRLNSMDDVVGTPVVQQINELPDARPSSVYTASWDEPNLELECGRASLNGPTAEPLLLTQNKKLNSIIQVDDPIDEKEEIDRDERKKRMSHILSENAAEKVQQ